MTDDGAHSIAVVISLTAVCIGTYLVASVGWSLIVFGLVTIASIVYARTRGNYDQPD